MTVSEALIKEVKYIDIDDKYFPIKEAVMNSTIDLTGRYVDIYTIAIDGRTGEEHKVKIGIRGCEKITFNVIDEEEWKRRFE